MVEKFCCILPICGSASRIGNIPKFLLPISTNTTLLKNHLNNINKKCHCIIVIRPEYATFLFNYLNNFFNGNNFQIIINETKTMSETILSLNYEPAKIYSMLMPDTFFKEQDILDKMYQEFTTHHCDVVLGVFKIRECQKGKLGQVLFDDNDNLIDVIDKDKHCMYEWAWGTIMWNGNFVQYIDKASSHIGYGLMPALKNNLKIKVFKSNGYYYDCGTFEEYKELINTIE